METHTIKVRYSDGSFNWKTVEANNFGDACAKIYNESANPAFISGFEKRLW